MGTQPDLVRLSQERDLYRRLLELAEHEAPGPFVEDALALVVEVTGARQGYLEIQDVSGEPRWWTSVHLSDEELAGARRRISRGIIAEAIASGRTVLTPSAFLDARFSGQDSVRETHIEAVCCAPIGEPPCGVLYLQHTSEPGTFDESVRAQVELVTRYLRPALERVLARQATTSGSDPTEEFRRRLPLDTVIGCSQALADVLQQLMLAAPLDVTVLLTGESGTGKTLLARVIHQAGPRAGGPFVELNCANLPDELIESELFGAEQGAHSTATRRVHGKIAAAQHGTLFLDEIGELSARAQAKLLQLLHAKTYFPLGATEPRLADVRVIAASNTDLKEAVRQRQFREDLLYRLTVLPIRMPSLAERRDDVPLLADHLAAAAGERHRLPWVPLPPNTRHAAAAADWPGNVRELANAIEAAVIRAAGTGATQVEPAHLFPGVAPGPTETMTFHESTRRFQAELLAKALADHDWNVTQTARDLDLTRAHVHNLIRAFGLTRMPSS
jgi:transcriptional regulator with GAF, ATPase, and Fis domain